ncbi:MAG: VOC family protein [Frankiales bacterium]|nr:VOC family protein [Frankiales bacterium]
MDVQDLGRMAIVADPSGAPIGLWQAGIHRGLLTTAEPGHVAWCELHTAGFAQTLQFGRDVFGWDIATVADSPEFRYATGSIHGEEVVGVMEAGHNRPEGPTGANAPQWAVYLQVEDVDAALAHAVELGATTVHPPHDSPYGRLVALTDPTGALVKLVG